MTMPARPHNFVLSLIASAVLFGGAQVASAQAPGNEVVEALDGADALDLNELLELDIQVVSASKVATSLNEAPSIVTVISSEDITRWGYRTVAEALERVLGFYVVDDHVTPNAAVRGVSGGLRSESSIIKVMIDGHPVAYRPTNGNWLGAELVPLSAVEQIEIIRGPASALYGADAFMGVVNVITKTSRRRDGADIRLSGNYVDDNPGFGVDAFGAEHFGQLSVTASALYRREDRAGVELPGSSPSPNLPAGAGRFAEALGQESASGFLRLAYEPSRGTRLALGGYISLQNRDAAFAEQAQLTATDGAPGSQVSRSVGSVFANADLELDEDFDLSIAATGFFGGDTGDGRIEVANPSFYVQQEQDFLGVDLRLDGIWTPLEVLTFVVGGGLIVDTESLGETTRVVRADDSAEVVSAGVDQTFVNPGLFAQGTWQIHPQYLTMTGGVRYDWHNIYGSQVSGRFGLVSSPFEGVYLKALYGSAFKAPSPVLLYGQPAQSGDIIGNESLEPQYVHTVEGQLIVQPVRALSIGTNLAYSYVENLAVFSRSGFNNVARNVAELGTLSWESYVRASIDEVFGGYVSLEMLFSERNNGEEGFQSTLLGDEAGVYPDLQVRFGLWTEVARAVRATVQGRLVGERRASDLNVLANNGVYALDPYFVLDATLGSADLELFGRGRATVLELIGRNLLDSDGIYPGEGGVDYPLAPRTLMLRLRQTL